jgi:hypothetical protein
MSDPFEIPAWLRLTAEERAAAWSDRKLTNGQRAAGRIKQHRWDLPRTIDGAGIALLKQIERDRNQRQRERLAKLRGGAR